MTEARHPVTTTPMRAAIARRMVQSKQQAPHFYVSTEIEVDEVAAAAERYNVGRGDVDRVTLTAYLIKAVALALAEHPEFNAAWNGDVLERWDAINVGVAIAVDDGLIAPALLDCRARQVDDIAAGLGDLTARTRAGRLKAAEMTDATFTLSNLGMFEVSQFTAIVTPPQVAILATGRAYERPVVHSGKMVVRRILNATLSADHRAVDGVGAARYLGTLKRLLEAPAPWAPGADVA
jgi:pyruvate dehydrogenase E2 component (dihydrolipoamide acetyltransferase)